MNMTTICKLLVAGYTFIYKDIVRIKIIDDNLCITPLANNPSTMTFRITDTSPDDWRIEEWFHNEDNFPVMAYVSDSEDFMEKQTQATTTLVGYDRAANQFICASGELWVYAHRISEKIKLLDGYALEKHNPYVISNSAQAHAPEHKTQMAEG